MKVLMTPRRSVAIALLLVGATVALATWLGMLWHATELRRNAVATIERLGGYVTYGHQYNAVGNPIFVDCITGAIQPNALSGCVISASDAPRPGPFMVRSLLWHDAFWQVRTVSIGGAMSLREDDLRTIASLRSVTELAIFQAPVYDAGVAHLVSLQKLRKLDLGTTYVSDQGVHYLRSLPNLEELTLYQTRITDAAIPDIAAMKSLRYVDLVASNVTREGIETLKTMRSADLKQGPRGADFGERRQEP